MHTSLPESRKRVAARVGALRIGFTLPVVGAMEFFYSDEDSSPPEDSRTQKFERFLFLGRVRFRFVLENLSTEVLSLWTFTVKLEDPNFESNRSWRVSISNAFARHVTAQRCTSAALFRSAMTAILERDVTFAFVPPLKKTPFLHPPETEDGSSVGPPTLAPEEVRYEPHRGPSPSDEDLIIRLKIPSSREDEESSHVSLRLESLANDERMCAGVLTNFRELHRRNLQVGFLGGTTDESLMDVDDVEQ